MTTYHEGEATGPFERQAEAGRYTLPVVAERGVQDDGDGVGTLTLLGAEGEVLATVQTGIEVTQDTIAEIIQGAHDDAAIAALESGEQYVAAFMAAVLARHPAESLVQRLSAMQPPLSPEAQAEATQRGQYIANNVQRLGGNELAISASLLSAIRLGGDAGDLLRLGAGMLDDRGDSKLASAWIDAACAIDADFAGHEYTRALIRMSLGDPEGAKRSIAHLEQNGFEEAAASLRPYQRALFESLTLDIAADPRMELIETVAGMMAKPARSEAPTVEKVRRTMQQIATRIGHARQQLKAVFGDVEWLPPTLDHLLPDGPVEVELPDFNGIGFMHGARRDLLLLRWMCWALGIESNALPTSVSSDPHRPSHAAVLVIVARTVMLNGEEPNVQNWVEEGEPAESIAKVILEATPHQLWAGLPLHEADRGNRNFAFEDEHTLFKAFIRNWEEETTPFE